MTDRPSVALFVTCLVAQVAPATGQAACRLLDAAGCDGDRLVTLAAPLFARARGEAAVARDERNRVRGLVEAPREGAIVVHPSPGSAEYTRLASIGSAAIARGELAFCVLAGGMATRMGGVVKALVEALDGSTFLELRLRENRHWSRRAVVAVPPKPCRKL